MWYLILQILLCLILAFILGYLIARLLKMSSLKRKIEELELNIENLGEDLTSKTSLIEGELNNANKITSELKSDFNLLEPKFKTHSDQISDIEAKLTKSLFDKDYDKQINDINLGISNLTSQHKQDLEQSDKTLKEKLLELSEKFNLFYNKDDVDNKLNSHISTSDEKMNDFGLRFASYYSKDDVDEKLTRFTNNLNNIQTEFTNHLNEINYDEKIENLSMKLDTFYDKKEVDEKLNSNVTNADAKINELQLKLNSQYSKDDIDEKVTGLTSSLGTVKNEFTNHINKINYDEKIEGLSNKLDALYNNEEIDKKIQAQRENLDELKIEFDESLKQKNYDERLNELQAKFNLLYSKNDVDEKINYISNNLNNFRTEVNSELEAKDFDPKINELHSKLADINYDNQINSLDTKFGNYYLKPEVDKKINDYNHNFNSLREDFENELRSRDRLIKTLEERIKLLEKPPKPVIIPKDDDLKKILGVGKVLERLLNKNGITTFKQVALFTDSQIDDLSSKLGSFHDRIRRDNWTQQAKQLHAEKYNEEL